MKSVIWNKLWQLFEQDFKTEKIRRRNLDSKSNTSTPFEDTPAAASTDDVLSPIDLNVLENGPHFKEILIKNANVNAANYIPGENGILELPEEYCVTEHDLKEIAAYGIESDFTQPDNKDWLYQCNCDPEQGTPVVIPGDQEPGDVNLINKPLVCCDMCLRWQHWDCQAETVLDLLTLAKQPPVNNNKKDKLMPLAPIHGLSQRDFGVVLLGQVHVYTTHSNRRSTRQRVEEEDFHEEKSEWRPTDKRKPFGECVPFICGWCLQKMEKELRDVFIPELRIIRAKQKKQHDDRERRKRAKEEKKRLEELRLQEESKINSVPTFPQANVGFVSNPQAPNLAYPPNGQIPNRPLDNGATPLTSIYNPPVISQTLGVTPTSFGNAGIPVPTTQVLPINHSPGLESSNTVSLASPKIMDTKPSTVPSQLVSNGVSNLPHHKENQSTHP